MGILQAGGIRRVMQTDIREWEARGALSGQRQHRRDGTLVYRSRPAFTNGGLLNLFQTEASKNAGEETMRRGAGARSSETSSGRCRQLANNLSAWAERLA